MKHTGTYQHCRYPYLLAIILGLLMGSCKDPNSPRLDNPHDYHSATYTPDGPSQFRVIRVAETSRTLEWQLNSRYAAGYRIERKLGSDGTYTVLAQVAAGVSSFVDTTVIRTDTTYYYRLCSFSTANKASESESLTVSITFAPPTDLHFTSLSPTSVELEWNGGFGFQTGYRLLQSIDSHPFTSLAVLPANTESYAVSGLNSNSTYTFAVQAITQYNNSRYSDFITISAATGKTQLVYSRVVTSVFEPVYSLAVSPDGKYIWCGGLSYIDVYRSGDGNHVATMTRSNNSPVNSIRFSPNGKIVADGQSLGIVLWDASNFRKLNELRVYGTNDICSVAFTPTSDTVVGLSWIGHGTIQLWNVPNGNLLNSFPTGGYTGRGCDVSPDGRYVATGDSLMLFRISDGVLQYSFPSVSFLNSVQCHPSGEFIACIGGTNKLQFWNVADGTLRREIQESPWIVSLAFDRDGSRIAAAGRQDGALNVWDVQSGSLWTTLNHPAAATSVAFSPLNNFMVTADNQGTVRVWAFAGTWVMK